MKTLNILVICLTVGIFSATGASKTILPTDTLIEYTGRIDFSTPLSPGFSYSGVSIRANFAGTAISAVLNDEQGNNYYNIMLDHSQIRKIKLDPGQKTYILAENLKDTIHEIEIFKLTEEQFGKTNFLGFSMDETDSLVEISGKRDLLFEFIGNSIECGYGNEGISGGTFGPSTENHYYSFAAITSRTFNARHLAVCKSGIGIHRNYGTPAGGNDCMPNYYDRIYLNSAQPKYSFTDTPDLICINLGTNDFSTPGGDSSLFVNNYLKFIDSLQSYYSMPDIVCLIGPMLGGTTLSNVKNYLQFIADSSNNKGKGNVWFFELTQQQGDLGTGIDGHPTIPQHMKNSRELIKYISTLKGWQVSPRLLRADLNTTTELALEFSTGIFDNTGNFNGLQVKADADYKDIDTVYKSETDSFKLIIRLSEPVNIGQNISVGYTSGQIKGSGSSMLEPFNAFTANNKLTETKILSGKINSEGSLISLSFNKKMQLPASLADIHINSNRGTIESQSVALSNSTFNIVPDTKIFQDDTIKISYTGQSVFGADGVLCTSFTDFIITNQSRVTTSVENKEYENRVVFYPNPLTSNILNYTFQQEGIVFPIKLSVFNSAGKLVYSSQIYTSTGSIQIDQQLVPKNVYYIQLEAENYWSSYKIIY